MTNDYKPHYEEWNRFRTIIHTERGIFQEAFDIGYKQGQTDTYETSTSAPTFPLLHWLEHTDENCIHCRNYKLLFSVPSS